MANRLEGNEFLNPNFLDQPKESAEEFLVLIQEITKTLKGGIAANSKKIQLISPDSVQNINEFNKAVRESEQAIEELNHVTEIQARINKTTGVTVTKLSKEQERAANIDVASRKRREAAFKRYERALKREQRELHRANSLYQKIQVQINHLTKTYNDLAVKQELGIKLTDREITQLENLEIKLNQYQKVLKTTDARIGKNQRNVGNYKSAFDGLGFSVAQLTREAPAFANSMQTGFMAISNNIPMLVDEINKLKVANRDLIAQGKPAVSVFKKIGSAIFGWQTLLSVGITLLTIYGADIVDFIKGTDEAAESQERLAKATEEANDQLVKETAELDVLFEALKNTNVGSEERAQLIEDINNKYGTTLKNMKDEAAFAEQIETAYAGVVEQLEKKIKLQIVEDELVEVMKRQREQVKKVEEAEKALTQARDKESKVNTTRVAWRS